MAGYTVMGKSAVQDCMGLVLSVRGKNNLGYRVIPVEVKQALRPPVCWFNPIFRIGDLPHFHARGWVRGYHEIGAEKCEPLPHIIIYQLVTFVHRRQFHGGTTRTGGNASTSVHSISIYFSNASGQASGPRRNRRDDTKRNY